MKTIKLALVDDHNLFRKGLISMMSGIEDFEVIIEATNGKEFLENPLLNQVDLVLLDIEMPELDGIKVTEALRKSGNNEIKIIIISMHDEDQFVLHLMETGANGYLLKDSDPDEVETAIRKCIETGNYFSDFLSSIMLKKMKMKPIQNKKIFNYKTDLSVRELEILTLICSGITTNEIGKRIHISPRTVEGHRLRIIEKLGVKNTAGLVAYAIKNNLV
jgi:two-component system, NarL family, response regulator DegU